MTRILPGSIAFAVVLAIALSCDDSHTPNSDELGSPCTVDADCASDVCLHFSTGQAACTKTCETTDDCLAGWECPSTDVCTCEPVSEACNGSDDDCDGTIDDGVGAAVGCSAGEICVDEDCECLPENRCGSRCVDLTSNADHCGSCGNACDTGETCVASTCCSSSGDEECDGEDNDCDGEVDEGTSDSCDENEQCIDGACACPEAAACGTACVDIERDEAHCGSCDNACTSSEVCAGGTCCEIPETVAMLDVLLMVDNSGSMFEEQGLLADVLPTLVSGLVTGDYDGDGAVEGRPVESLHVGVITPDMGTTYPVTTCEHQPYGDDGILVNDVPVGGAACPSNFDDRYFAFDATTDADGDGNGTVTDEELATATASFASDVSCVTTVGTQGCGYEQQLDAVLKALVPSDSAYTFAEGTGGNGDGANAGFLREGAGLAVIMLTDEDDCSTTNRELYAQNGASPTFTSVENLRCYYYPQVLQPPERFSAGLLSLGVEPDALVFGLIAGIPAAIDEESYDTILADPDMQERVNPADSTELVPACVHGFERAIPARRMVTVAKLLQEAGAHTVARSICRDDYGETIAAILDAVGQTVVPTTCD